MGFNSGFKGLNTAGVWRTFIVWRSRYWDDSVKRYGQRYQSGHSFRAGYLHFWHIIRTACIFSAQPLLTYLFTLILTVRSRVCALLESLCLINCWLIYAVPSITLLLARRSSGCATGNTKFWILFSRRLESQDYCYTYHRLTAHRSRNRLHGLRSGEWGGQTYLFIILSRKTSVNSSYDLIKNHNVTQWTVSENVAFFGTDLRSEKEKTRR